MAEQTKQNAHVESKNKILNNKETTKKIKDLKIELLKSPTKRGRVKKEIARLLTMANMNGNNQSSVDEKTNKNKLAEGKK